MTSSDAPSVTPDEVEDERARGRAAADSAQRTRGVFVVVTLLLATFPLLALVPSFASAFGSDVVELGILCAAVWSTIALTTFTYHRFGRASSSYRILNRFETYAVQAALLFLIYRSHRPDSFVWIIYFVHLVASAPLGLASDLRVMCATPLILTVVFSLDDNSAAAAFAVGVSVLAFFFITMILQSQHALARAEAERHKVLAQLADLRLEQERGRIARDLHDGLGADLTAMAWRLEALLMQHRDSPLASPLGQLAGRLRLATDDLRSVVWLIRMPELRCAELSAHMRTRGLEISPPGTSFTLEVEGAADDALVAGEVALHVVLAFQEAVRNAAAHGVAKVIKARLELAGPSFRRLLVEDDGHGFDATRPTRPEGGVSNLSTRAKALGAELAITSTAAGTRVDLATRAG